MKSYQEFNELIFVNKILYIPIISCINRDTQEYNLACDGNVNRFITTFTKCNQFTELTIVLPKNHIKGTEYLIEAFKYKCSGLAHKINIEYCNYFGIHAGEQRNNEEVVSKMFEYICDRHLRYDNHYNIVIFESQKLGKKIIEEYSGYCQFDTIFWNPVSKTDKTRDFLEGYDDINNWLINNSDFTIVASPNQYEFYKEYQDKIFYLDELIDRKLPVFNSYNHNNMMETILDLISIDNKIFYLPYRLTDKGYNMDLVLKYLLKEYIECIEYGIGIRILYSDPNHSHYLDIIDIPNEIKKLFIKVSSDRDTYYTILDYKNSVTIPYFEDIEFINHASINEFKDSNATVILYNQNNNPYNIDNFNNFINIKEI